MSNHFDFAAKGHDAGQRLKLSGMHWSQAGATGILTLRCQQVGDRWDEIWTRPRSQATIA